MSEKQVHTLLIDKEFKSLIRPLNKAEYLQLETNIIADGCREPLAVWNGYIVDGHNRYEICRRHRIPFDICQMEFECRAEAIAWICANQLGRRNITEETRKFLIGMQYESEKTVNRMKNAQGINQYSIPNEDYIPSQEAKTKLHRTAERIAAENHISQGTVQKYAEYTRALEDIGRKVPTLVPMILSGRYKISHKTLIDLSKQDATTIRKAAGRMELTQQPFIQYSQTRREIQASKEQKGEDPAALPSVKDMPTYDPDAEVTGLTLTIPTWASSIERMRKKTNMRAVSDGAKVKLVEALFDLQTKIEEVLGSI